MFEFEKLVVFQKAMNVAAAVELLLRTLPVTHRDLRDQLRRAIMSVVLNIAEGAGEFSPAEKARFYRMARRFALESAGALLLGQRYGLLTPAATHEPLAQLAEVANMLTAMCRKYGK